MLKWIPVISTGLVALIIVAAVILVLMDFNMIKRKKLRENGKYFKNILTVSVGSRILLLAVMVFMVKFFHEGIRFFDFKRIWLVFTNSGIESPWQYMLVNNLLFVCACGALYCFISRRWSKESGILAVSLLCIMPATIINTMPGLSSLILLIQILFVWMYYEKKWLPVFVFGALAVGLDNRTVWLIGFTLLAQLFLYFESRRKSRGFSKKEIRPMAEYEIEDEDEDEAEPAETEESSPQVPQEPERDTGREKKQIFISCVFILLSLIGLIFSVKTQVTVLGIGNALDMTMASGIPFNMLFVFRILPQITVTIFACYTLFSLMGKNEFYMGLLVLLAVCIGLYTYKSGPFLEFAIPVALAVTNNKIKPFIAVLLIFTLGVVSCLGMYIVS